MNNEIKKPLVPKSAGGAVVAGGTLTAVLGALGWVGSTLMQLDQDVVRVTDHNEAMKDRIYTIAADIDKLQERLVILEQVVLKK